MMYCLTSQSNKTETYIVTVKRNETVAENEEDHN